jgi:mRNA interferase RelE/StbE
VTTPYHVRIAPTAATQIRALAGKHQKIIVKLAEALSINPRPPGAKKIEGMTGLYSETVNDHRLVYRIEDQEVMILLVK